MSPDELALQHQAALSELASRYISLCQSADDLVEIGVLLQSRVWSPGEIVVEIGTYHGHTAAFMATVLRAMGAPFVPVVSIDPFERCQTAETSSEVHGEYIQYALRTMELSDQCCCIAAASVQAAQLIPPKIGFLLVDGSHKFQDCLADLTLYVPKVVPGGIVVVDDDAIHQYPGVVKAVDVYFAGWAAGKLDRTGRKAVLKMGNPWSTEKAQDAVDNTIRELRY